MIHDMKLLRWLQGFVCVAVFFAMAGTAWLEAQQPSNVPMINRESKIKAAYLYNFARYIQWPEDTFKNEKEPFCIGIVGTDPIKKNLEQLAKSKTINGRSLRVKQFTRPIEVQPCQILFISPSLKPESQQQILRSMEGKNVLMVGQSDAFLDMGGVIDFVVRNNKVRLMVDLDAAQREKLKFSAKLLRVAKVVK
jgi:hypothetical protein